MAINILVTEDESIVLKDIERCLGKLGYNVVATADNGEKAIELALKHKPDLALMDIMIKGDMTGIAAAEEIKRNLDIPVVFLTAYADENTLSQAKMAEPHGYILKPFKEVDIQTAVEMALHKHSKELELKTEADFLRGRRRQHDLLGRPQGRACLRVPDPAHALGDLQFPRAAEGPGLRRHRALEAVEGHDFVHGHALAAEAGDGVAFVFIADGHAAEEHFVIGDV